MLNHVREGGLQINATFGDYFCLSLLHNHTYHYGISDVLKPFRIHAFVTTRAAHVTLPKLTR